MAAFTIRLYRGQAIQNCKFENKNMCDWAFIK